MSPISYLDEWERLELVELRYRIVEALGRLATDMKLDPSVWAVYVLLNFAKLPEDLVQKLVAKTTAMPGGEPALPPGMEAESKEAEEWRRWSKAKWTTSGFFALNESEKREVATAIHKSPELRRIIGNISYYHEDDLASIRQVDPSIIPVTVRGRSLTDSYADDPEAKQLHEDLASVKAKKPLTEVRA